MKGGLGGQDHTETAGRAEESGSLRAGEEGLGSLGWEGAKQGWVSLSGGP